MFDRWGLRVSVTQCCPSMDSACISASQFPCSPQWESPPRKRHSQSPSWQLGWVAMKVGFQTSHWFKAVQPRGFQRWHLESVWRFSCHVPPGTLLKLDLVAAFTQTTLPPLVFPGVCQWLTEGPSFGAGTLQSLRVWWKKEAVLTELPYDSEHLLEGI